MNDLEKLSKVVDSLENQARQVDQFSGVLRAVHDAHSKIEESRANLDALGSELRKLIGKQSDQYNEMLTLVTNFDKKLIEIRNSQHGIEKNIAQLTATNTKQFQELQKSILAKLDHYDRTTHDLHNESRAINQDAITMAADSIIQHLAKVDKAQSKSNRLLQITFLTGQLVMTIIIAFAAYQLIY